MVLRAPLRLNETVESAFAGFFPSCRLAQPKHLSGFGCADLVELKISKGDSV